MRTLLVRLLSLALAASPAADGITPGSLGLLIQRPDERSTMVALANGLRDASPEVRATAARVANVIDAAGLLPDLRTALQTENDLNAAREEMRALTNLGTAEDDALVIEAANRLGGKMGPIGGDILARARGPAAIPLYFARLDHGDFTAGERVSILRLACRSRPEAFYSAAAAALSSGHTDDWLAVLLAATEAAHPPPTGSLVTALSHPSGRTRSDTAWLLLEIFAGRAPSSREDLLRAIDGAAAPDTEKIPGSDEVVGPELLARVLGRPPSESPALLAAMENPRPGRIDRIAGAGWLPDLLASGERDAFARRLKGFPPETPPNQPAPAKSRDAATRYPSGLPKGLAVDLLAPTGCVPEDLAGGARVRFDDPGRPEEVTLEDSLVAPPCQLAASLIFCERSGERDESLGRVSRPFVGASGGRWSR